MQRGSSQAGRDPTDTSYHWWENTRSEHDHVDVPLGRNWRIAGTVVGAIVVFFVVTVALAEPEDETIAYRTVLPIAVETDAIDEPIVTGIDIEVEVENTDEGRVRVAGDGLVRADVAGDAFCRPVSGAAGAWIDVSFCGPIDTLTITATGEDNDVTAAVAQF